MPTEGMVAVRTTYRVRAKRWARGWELHIDGIGVTQSRSLGGAEAMARDYISLDLDMSAQSFELEIIPHIGGGLDEEVARVRQEIRAAERAQLQAAEHSREVVRRLKEQGLTGKDTAAVLGISPQRVSQLAVDRRRASTVSYTLRSSAP